MPWPAYQATRDALSLPLFEVVDTIASHQWTNAEIGDLLRRLSSSMTDEVELLAGLDGHDLSLATRGTSGMTLLDTTTRTPRGSGCHNPSCS